jgi:hypothetical protein|tara:strand:+ start:5481 stop:5888 length:408 start_codon:yes stop_codon:yes gene_type:complete
MTTHNVRNNTMYTHKGKSKYGARKTTFMGIKFDSKWEAERWGELTAMERANYITDLERQIKYDIIVNDQKICRYIADFRYSKVDEYGNLEEVVEDAKGVETPEFKLKKKLMKAVLGIDIYLSKKGNNNFLKIPLT